MIGYQPNFRPVVRAQMAQAAPPPAPPATVPVPASVAASTSDVIAASGRTPNLALLTAGIGTLAGGAAAYGSYIMKKNMKSTRVVIPAVFGLFNLAIFSYILIEG